MADGVPRIGSSVIFSTVIWDLLCDAVESMQARQLGRGVVSGLALSDNGGFTLGIAAGVLSNGLRQLTLAAPATATATASVTRYVWVTPVVAADESVSVTVAFTATSADPGGTAVCLGRVICDGSGITSVDEVGRVELPYWSDVRTWVLGGGVLTVDLLTGIVTAPILATTSFDAGTVDADVVAIPQSGSAPAAASNVVKIYSKDVSGTCELFVRGEGGVELQLTSGGALAFDPMPYADGSVPGGNTVGNTTTETAFASTYSIPANRLAVGSVIRVRLFGVYSTFAVAPNITGKVKIGGVTVLNTGAITTIAGVTNVGWSAEAFLVVTAIGASGSVEAQGYASFSTAAAAALAVHVANTAAVGGIDTTGALPVTATVQWSAANAASTITARIMTVEIL